MPRHGPSGHLMERIWHRSYPPGVPFEVDVDAYHSIADLFDRSVAKFGTRTAFVNMDTSISYSELERVSGDFGAYLQLALKLQPGARVALMLPNILQYPIALFAALRCGYTVVNCNPLYMPRELCFQLVNSGADAIVVLENCAWVVAEIIGATNVRHVVTTQLGDMLNFPRDITVNFAVKFLKRMVRPWRIPGAVPFRSALRLGTTLRERATLRQETQSLIPKDLGPDSIAFLQYTSGTTGAPRAAMLTHRNIIANLQQIDAYVRLGLEEGRETVVTALPLYHIFALTVNCLFFFKFGAVNLLISDPRDIANLIGELRKHPFTVIAGVNTLFNALLNSRDFAGLDFSHLHLCIAGGMAVQKAVAIRWKQVTGKPLVEGYGLTEASPAVTFNPINLADYNGSIGLPLPSTDIAVRDEEGHDLPIGAAGELCVRGPQIMRGYWNAPEETAKTIVSDGFLRSGDVATVNEEGFVRIVDRKKDVIKVSGFNVYPNEIEDVIALHEGVLEVGAIGVPDLNSGEAVKIVVVKRRPDLTADELIAHCRKYLTGYKIPRHVEFRTTLPKTNIGKIQRRSLRTHRSQLPANS
jgi:long-chain acyl-CoA synthetase